MGEPARGYSWPPFEPGHTKSVKHGAASPRLVSPIAERLAADLVESAPWAGGRQFAETVRAWAWAQAQCVLLHEYLDVHGVLDDRGVPRPAVGLLERVETRAASLRGELGLSPLALARLLGALGQLNGEAAVGGLEQLAAAGRAVRVGAERRALTAGTAPATSGSSASGGWADDDQEDAADG